VFVKENHMNLDPRKLASHTTWLFALGTLLVAIAATKLAPSSFGPKVWAAIYFALFGAGAAASVFFTRSSTLLAIAAFALAGLGLGAFYFVTIRSHMAGAGSFGTGTAIVFTVVFAVDAVAAGIAGALFGRKLRQGLGSAVALR
jgi:hypothetical protein